MKIIVKHWKRSSSQSSQKKNSYTSFKAYLATMILAALTGTYLDLFFVGKGVYSFPSRPFPQLFSIDILFTLIVLPVFTALVIYVLKRSNRFFKLIILLTLVLGVVLFEYASASLGLLNHSNEWNYFYSSFGYTVFILLMWMFHEWMLPN